MGGPAERDRNDFCEQKPTNGSLHSRVHKRKTSEQKFGDLSATGILGDAVIRLAVSESLYRGSNGNGETLHNSRERLIPNRFLTDAAKELALPKYLRSSGIADVMKSPLVAAKLYEALTGVIFLDKGFTAASKFVEETLILPRRKTGTKEPRRENSSTDQ